MLTTLSRTRDVEVQVAIIRALGEICSNASAKDPAGTDKVVGALATVLVAAFPLPPVGTSQTHGLVAGLAFITLGLWPAFAWRHGQTAPWGLRPYVSLMAAFGLVVLLGLFAAQLSVDGGFVGLTERLVAGAEAIWPLVVVLTARRRKVRTV